LSAFSDVADNIRRKTEVVTSYYNATAYMLNHAMATTVGTENS